MLPHGDDARLQKWVAKLLALKREEQDRPKRLRDGEGQPGKELEAMFCPSGSYLILRRGAPFHPLSAKP